MTAMVCSCSVVMRVVLSYSCNIQGNSFLKWRTLFYIQKKRCAIHFDNTGKRSYATHIYIHMWIWNLPSLAWAVTSHLLRQCGLIKNIMVPSSEDINEPWVKNTKYFWQAITFCKIMTILPWEVIRFHSLKFLCSTPTRLQFLVSGRTTFI